MDLTRQVWFLYPEDVARSGGHPAPFPEELPHRLIQLYTFKGDVVLDPFCGSGNACLAALKDGRHYIGYDIEPEYIELANRRIKAHSSQKNLFEHEPPSRTINSNEELARQSI